MCKLTQLFSMAELKGLDARQLDALRERVLHHLRTSPQVHKILRAKVRPVHRRLKSRQRAK